MHFVGHADWAFADTPQPPTVNTQGLSRRVVVGPAQGAVHTELALGSLAHAGFLNHHVHSYEEALYLLSGELLMDIDGHAHRLMSGDFALLPIGMWHALANDGSAPARWLSVNTPQKYAPEQARRDTFFSRDVIDVAAVAARAERPRFGHPTTRNVGHYAGTAPQAEALAVRDPARGRKPIGADTALLAYSGISVKMLVDRVFGAHLLTMFTVDYEVGGAAQAHDHPFEETYFFLDGEVQAELDGQPYTLRAGDVVFAGVGSSHGFWNDGPERVRWIETQAPQPPARHSYRWLDTWKGLEEETS